MTINKRSAGTSRPPKHLFCLWFVYKIPILRVVTQTTSFPSDFRTLCNITTMQHYYNATLLQCNITTMQYFYNATLLQCNITTMQHYYNATLLQCKDYKNCLSSRAIFDLNKRIISKLNIADPPPWYPTVPH